MLQSHINFTGDKLAVVDPATGEVAELDLYVSNLGHSEKSYVEAIPSQKKKTF